MNIKRRELLGLGAIGLLSYYIYSKPMNIYSHSKQKPRVVTLEYLPTEMLLQLGIIPVGAADIRGYKRWVNYKHEFLTQSTSVGTRQQPVLEYIAALKPDLIIGIQFRHQSLFDIFNSIAPTYLIPDTDNISGLTALKQNWFTIAQYLDQEIMANHLWENFNEKLQSLKLRIQKHTDEMIVLQGIAGSPLFWGFHANSIPGGLVEYMGWKLPAKLNLNRPQGISYFSVEQLLSQQADLTIITDIQTKNFSNNHSKLTHLPVWRNIPAIKEKRYRELPLTIWPFGGLIKTIEMAEAFATQWEAKS